MAESKRVDFCTECRRETEYCLQKKNITKTIRDVEHVYSITVAVCSKCGMEMSIPGLIDTNIKEIDMQYRAYENIATIDDIEKLMDIYAIGKAPLALALGFGEVTITRYLAGQIPSKEYSNIIKMALSSPAYMKKKLYENRDKIAHIAFDKALESTEKLEKVFCVSNKMLRAIAYIFEVLEEVTPLMLQKILYFIQGESYVISGKPMFCEDCQAWIHGPVYPKVYNIFRDFKYNPIEDARFIIFKGSEDALTAKESQTIDLVLKTFGKYSGKILERITHEEEPWKLARRGYADNIMSNELITKESIKAYYLKKNAEYDFSAKEGLNRYIDDILSTN